MTCPLSADLRWQQNTSFSTHQHSKHFETHACECGQPAGMLSWPHARIAGPGCNLVLPLSTAHGKGYRKQESVEAVFDLPPRASAWVNQIHNFGRLQAVLESVPASRDTLILDTRDVHNSSYSGAYATLLPSYPC